ncbi:Hypothetical protein POVN_LOCUS404, partial [uncultured virus]
VGAEDAVSTRVIAVLHTATRHRVEHQLDLAFLLAVRAFPAVITLALVVTRALLLALRGAVEALLAETPIPDGVVEEALGAHGDTPASDDVPNAARGAGCGAGDDDHGTGLVGRERRCEGNGADADTALILLRKETRESTAGHVASRIPGELRIFVARIVLVAVTTSGDKSDAKQKQGCYDKLGAHL